MKARYAVLMLVVLALALAAIFFPGRLQALVATMRSM